MSIDENKIAARRMTFDVFAKGDVSSIDALTTADFVNHGQTDGSSEGRASLKNAIERVRAAFPDFEYSLVHELADGPFVVHHLRARGTHEGVLIGAPPTGKRAEWTEVHVMRFDDDSKMVEQWGVVDRLGILAQLGLFPPPRR